MDPSNSFTSGQRPSSPSVQSYQARILERANSTLSRNTSTSSRNSVLNTPTGTTATRKWAPGHRVTHSLDTLKGKWEERSRDRINALDALEGRGRNLNDQNSSSVQSDSTSPLRKRYTDLIPSSPRTPRGLDYAESDQTTPSPLKRHTLYDVPPPIIASPLSPNNTGVTVEGPEPSPFSTPTPARIRLPITTTLPTSSISSPKRQDSFTSQSSNTDHIPSFRARRANTLNSLDPSSTGSSVGSDATSISSTSSHSQRVFPADWPPSGVSRRPTSIHSGHSNSIPSPVITSHPSTSSSSAPSSRARAHSLSPDKYAAFTAPSNSSSVMSPKPYVSSYMNKKNYGNIQSAQKRLGNHLPRIASGDAPEDWDGQQPEEKELPPPPAENRRRERASRDVRVRDWQIPSPEKSRPPDLVFPGDTTGDDVAGIPGRIRLSRNKPPSAPTSPLNKRPTHGLWADVQRNLIQAYEYLCHVGEAQQWIEGCLGELLEFGVVEMEEGLRNGVVLAKLVRVFQGEAVVRKIYEAPKLDFRHSDNINIFFNFVRHVGLPESFIFELTDLYEKKNFPKVIYCIHALSHLLARRGLAPRIGDLLGQLRFSDDQLQKTQKGLKDSGVAMPNFGNVGRELAKEINEPEEIEVETESERIHRELEEHEDSIMSVQSQARAYLVRKAHATQHVRLRLAEPQVRRLQAVARGVLVRSIVKGERSQVTALVPWATALQAHVRGILFRRAWLARLRQIKATTPIMTKLQAQVRGVLQRRKFAKLKAAMRSSKVAVIKLQSLARARIAQRSHTQLTKTFTRPVISFSIVAFQAHARGSIVRARLSSQDRALLQAEESIIYLQAHARGLLLRRRFRSQMAKLEDISDIVVRIQAAVRTYLARKRLLSLIRGLRKATPALVGLQARARATLARQKHAAMNKALSEVKVITSVGGFQAFARAAIMRNRHREQTKSLEFAEPDVVGFQAAARGALVRWEYYGWRDFLRRSHPHATILQALLRGALQRKIFRAKMQYFRANLDKIVGIQSLIRAKETREQYRQLTLGTNVSVGTIKNFVHLLDDSEADFQEEIKVERLREEVVKRIRENQSLENEVNDLDVKIALVVQNAKNYEELAKAGRRHGDNAAVRARILADHGDPFAGPSTLDYAAKKKLELYQQLFYLLQTKGDYLTKLFSLMTVDQGWEKNRRLMERVVLSLFGYGHERREDFLILKLFQTAIHDEVASAANIEAVAKGHPAFINVVVQYVRPKQAAYIRDTLQKIVLEVVDSDDVDLETDPRVIYRASIDIEEMRTGMPSSRSKDIGFHEAVHEPDTRAEYIRHLQQLQWWTDAFIVAVTKSTSQMPYAMRFLARETLHSLKAKFPRASKEQYASCIARLVYYRFINPAIITPETFDIVSHTVDIAARKNLAQISRVLTQVTSGTEFGEDSPCYLPINEHVRVAIQTISDWLIEVANVPDVETQYHAHEFLDATVEPKAIYVSPNEVYTMHSLLSQYLDVLAPARDDTLRLILTELGGVPHIGSEELNEARDAAIELQLTNRFAHVKDPAADEKALWVQAKRAVLAILRVQPAQNLVESLMLPVTDEHLATWERIVEDMDREQMKNQRRMPSTTGAEVYRLEDIRSMSFHEVKAQAIFYLLELEKRGKINRDDGYQGILNAIAGDVRSKNRRRVQRQHEKETMQETLKAVAARRKRFEEQIDSYNNYVETAMANMQRGKGKRRFVIPFTKQYFHMRDLQRSGKSPQFGSFKYSAQYFYEKHILLSIDPFSPRQFDKIDIVLSSNSVGVFTIEVFNNTLGITNRVGSADVKMEELLQAKFEDRASISLYNGAAKFNLERLLRQINKKFYV